MDPKRHPSPERLDRYLRGTLLGAARDSVERHFMICAACFERVRFELAVALVGTRPRESKGKVARDAD